MQAETARQAQWQAHTDNNEAYWDIDNEHGERIASVSIEGCIDMHGHTEGQIIAEGRAKLLASAPELLAAIKRIRQAFYVDGKRNALLAALEGTKELVAKAEGGAV